MSSRTPFAPYSKPLGLCPSTVATGLGLGSTLQVLALSSPGKPRNPMASPRPDKGPSSWISPDLQLVLLARHTAPAPHPAFMHNASQTSHRTHLP